MRSVFAGRIEQDRHLIKWHALRCFSLNTPNDFDAFAWFAWPAVNPQTLVEWIESRGRVLKKILLGEEERVCTVSRPLPISLVHLVMTLVVTLVVHLVVTVLYRFIGT